MFPILIAAIFTTGDTLFKSCNENMFHSNTLLCYNDHFKELLASNFIHSIFILMYIFTSCLPLCDIFIRKSKGTTSTIKLYFGIL